ncbi:hypothetical protein LTR64_003276 [Lithohypha guttulata]|uniref:uncharacterized protein n=1 Tax=Lithohypha guttulata TaxID=1690604 RepID=UPI00315C997C
MTSDFTQQSAHPPLNPPPFTANQPQTIRLHPLSNYTFGTKDVQLEEDPSVLTRLRRLEDHYEKHGMRRTCEGILVCHEHNHPHVLMLQIANAFFKLPGDYLPPEAEEIPAFTDLLNSRLAPTSPTTQDLEWQALSIPKNMKLLAVPLFELYDNTARYGPQLSAIPHYLSRYRFEFVDEEGRVSRVTPGGEAMSGGGGIKVLIDGEILDQNGSAQLKGEDDDEVDMKKIKVELGNVEGMKDEDDVKQ